MSQKQFDPRKFIDRDFEQELFEELLKPKDDARILAIQDAGGMGKSQLLQKFQYRCRTVRPRTPVSLIALDQLGESSPLALVQAVAQNLAAFALEFPRFDTAERARLAYDFTVIRGHVNLTNADLREAGHVDAAGIMIKSETTRDVNIHNGPSTFTPEQQAKAQETSVKAFFTDLKDCCESQPIVILLDAYERCDPELQTWLIDELLEHQFFNFEKRPATLLLVLAGRELPNFYHQWSVEDCAAVVQTIESLSRWRAEHVEECLRVHGFTYTPQQLETFVKMVEIGLPPSQIMQGIQTLMGVEVR